MKDRNRFEGKVALLTGSGSALRGERMGFGGCAAWRMLEEGGKVVITDIQDARGEVAAEQMRDAGFDAIYRRLDVVDESQWSDVVADALDAFGRLDILVNLAGMQDRGTLYEVDVDEWRRVMEISTTGILLGTRAVIPAMTEAGGGSIVNMSSMAGKFAGEYGSAYAMSRAGMLHFTRHRRFSWRSSGYGATRCCRVGFTHRSRSTSMRLIRSAIGGRSGCRWVGGASRRKLRMGFASWHRTRLRMLRVRSC